MDTNPDSNSNAQANGTNNKKWQAPAVWRPSAETLRLERLRMEQAMLRGRGAGAGAPMGYIGPMTNNAHVPMLNPSLPPRNMQYMAAVGQAGAPPPFPPPPPPFGICPWVAPSAGGLNTSSSTTDAADMQNYNMRLHEEQEYADQQRRRAAYSLQLQAPQQPMGPGNRNQKTEKIKKTATSNNVEKKAASATEQSGESKRVATFTPKRKARSAAASTVEGNSGASTDRKSSKNSSNYIDLTVDSSSGEEEGDSGGGRQMPLKAVPSMAAIVSPARDGKNGSTDSAPTSIIKNKEGEGDPCLENKRLPERIECMSQQQLGGNTETATSEQQSDSKMPARYRYGASVFDDSPLLLCDPSLPDADDPNKKVIRTVAVAIPIAVCLEEHQKAGVKALWRTCFGDCNYHEQGDKSFVGGAVLAHMMGLGKTLTVLSLLHTVMTHPSLILAGASKPMPLFRFVLVLAPLTPLENWVSETEKWMDDLDSPLQIYNLRRLNELHYQKKEVTKWKKHGGILLMNYSMFSNVCKKDNDMIKLLQPDILVLDEAHTVLKTRNTQIYKNLNLLETKRRILLSGTPLQNNLSELYNMMEYVRPGIMSLLFDVSTEKDFKDGYRQPIEQGLHADATDSAKRTSLLLQNHLKSKLGPYVHRKERENIVLSTALPALKQYVLVMKPSSVQAKFLRFYDKKYKRKLGSKGPLYSTCFFKRYQEQRLISNHPYCLTMGATKSRTAMNDRWWEECNESIGIDKIRAVGSSSKIEILLHILAFTAMSGKKTLVFSQSIPTLNFIESLLQCPDWKREVKSLTSVLQGQKLGGWKKNKDYVRIDGAVNSEKRGCLISQFNADLDGFGPRVFLLSSTAGSLGINLGAANVVVLFDSHFNPAVDSQCAFRACRLNQKEDVTIIRLLTENSLEEKVHAKAVNKSRLARSVIDGKASKSVFTASETDLRREVDAWARCDDCGKRRKLLAGQEPPGELQDWFCRDNIDPRFNNCDAEEQDSEWYKDMAQEMEREHLMTKEPLLKHLAELKKKYTRGKTIVSHFYSHAIFDSSMSCEEQLKQMEQEMGSEKGTKMRKLGRRNHEE